MPYQPLSLEGKTALIVGGTSGIGKAIALAMAEAGANVIPSSRRMAEVKVTATQLEKLGCRTLRATVDVTEQTSVQALLATCLQSFNAVHILVNCAGRTAKAPTLHVTEDSWNQIIDTNLTGTLRCCQVFGQPMIEQGYGRIINIASLASFVGLYQVAAYTASKAAVAGLTKALAVEWARHGVCVNAIAPGVFRTPLNSDLLDSTDRGREFKLRTPLGRFGKVEELAGAAIFLASDAASFVCGEVLVVDGGFLASGVNQ